jgi:sporulation protein YlmC with PRC-barrel domain
MADEVGRHAPVRYSATDLQLEEPWQDVSGRDVYDNEGGEIGPLEDLYVDPDTQEVRFLVVSTGVLLGSGGMHFLIPVEAVSEVDSDRVTLDRDREQALGSSDLVNSGMPGPG